MDDKTMNYTLHKTGIHYTVSQTEAFGCKNKTFGCKNEAFGFENESSGYNISRIE